MKQRFVLTLLTVAIAAIGSTASAIAPVVIDMPSPVISDDIVGTQSNNIFVYPDALNADDWAYDPDGTLDADQLIWSYWTTGDIMINGADPLDLGTEDPNAPGAKELGALLTDDVRSVDGDTRTLTFRNDGLSPIASDDGSTTLTYMNPPANPNGVWPPVTTPTLIVDSEVVTVIVSDGTTAGTGSLMVYTEDNGTDRLSGTVATELDNYVPTSAGGWTSFDGLPGLSVITLTDSGTGLCVEVPLEGVNLGGWYSPFGIVPLVANNVYRFRIQVEATEELPAGTTPFWDFTIDNNDATAPNSSENKFTATFMNQDSFDGANSVGLAGTVGRAVFDIWWAPMPIDFADWNDPVSGEFTATRDAVNDIRLMFRLLDVDGPIAAADDAGTLCLSSITAERVHKSMMTVADPRIWSNGNFIDTGEVTISYIFGPALGNSTVVFFEDGDVIISPDNGAASARGTNAWLLEVVNLDVGDNIIDFNNPGTVDDNWPIPWESDQLLRAAVDIQAQDDLGEFNPPDVIRMNFDTATTELLLETAVVSGTNTLGMPKADTEGTYYAYFYTQNQSLTDVDELNAIRSRFGLIMTPDILSAGSFESNNGGVRINDWYVDEMGIPAGF